MVKFDATFRDFLCPGMKKTIGGALQCTKCSFAFLFSPVPFTGCLRAYRFHFTSPNFFSCRSPWVPAPFGRMKVFRYKVVLVGSLPAQTVISNIGHLSDENFCLRERPSIHTVDPHLHPSAAVGMFTVKRSCSEKK